MFKFLHKIIKEFEPYLSSATSLKQAGVGMSALGAYLAWTNPIVELLGLPLSLMLGAGIGLWIWGLIKDLQRVKITKTPSAQPIKLEEVVGKKFKHQTVRIDGKKFVNCEFYGCTIEYAGGDFNFDGSGVGDNCGFSFLTKETAAAANLILNFATIMNHDPNKSLGKFDEYGRKMDEPKIIKINEPQTGVKS